ncbi:hypothetical protein D9758_008527 [Tetrapyrgos nigripes]|uniref:Ubiquitin-like domain-containing protein n=1 Tax=Tetrapyrgos nigripes TaxID=182062 RepID=A0A8H5G5T9_9AGAR|nr:hypothetical protein D9758_008527 [Tetrapyrgos nigripes]
MAFNPTTRYASQPTITVCAGRVPNFAHPSFPLTFFYSPSDTVGHLKTKIQVKIRRFYSSRQQIVLKDSKKPLSDDTLTFHEAGINAGDELEVVDLGPQVPRKFAGLLQYAGPIVAHAYLYFLPQFFYGKAIQHSLMQSCVFAMIEVHFVKRILETLFVHRFSRPTVPVLDFAKNLLYYNVLGGIVLAFDLYRQTFSDASPYIEGTIKKSPIFLWACVALWAFFQLSNLSTLLTLRSLRRDGNAKRRLPRGYGTHYLFEALGWMVICLMSGCIAAWLFFLVGTIPAAVRVLDKQRKSKS